MSDPAVFILQAINLAENALKEAVWPVIQAWWWAPLPFILFEPAKKAWLYWLRLKNFKNREYILLEIKVPEEIRKPIRAMEDVFTSMYMIALEHAPSMARETWLEGESVKHTTFSLEIVSIGGTTRFFIWVEEHLRNAVESIFHAQYPGLEFSRVEDYVKQVPQDIPNKEWDLEGHDWDLKKEDVFPLKTYKEFETGTEPKEEKRVDPMARLLEAFDRLEQGEQIWLQFTMTDAGRDWVKEGEKLRDELANREVSEPAPHRPLLLEALEILLFGMPEEKEKEEKPQFLPPEMKLTPGERAGIEEMEKKMAQQGFKVGVRIIYLGKKEVFYKPHIGLPISFLSSMGTGDQYLKPYPPTRTKVKYLVNILNISERIAFLKKRRLFRNYKWRVFPEFPFEGGTSVLTPEELATMFHFPGAVAAPGPSLERLEHKRGGPPPTLPTE